ncbi:hypothetical protein [Marinigracilibium pacificum]|uniref:Uncharacterized protein n=1 Tax=Marinigracilibium pacificum TaxID=2729599 RepID=A0A848J391_9BACT|nr:hypothetical protein [Marinigracilibium pacificum]NMM49975.1 hypothetical protein [Marinigracilibium pacificum]
MMIKINFYLQLFQFSIIIMLLLASIFNVEILVYVMLLAMPLGFTQFLSGMWFSFSQYYRSKGWIRYFLYATLILISIPLCNYLIDLIGIRNFKDNYIFPFYIINCSIAALSHWYLTFKTYRHA